MAVITPSDGGNITLTGLSNHGTFTSTVLLGVSAFNVWGISDNESKGRGEGRRMRLLSTEGDCTLEFDLQWVNESTIAYDYSLLRLNLDGATPVMQTIAGSAPATQSEYGPYGTDRLSNYHRYLGGFWGRFVGYSLDAPANGSTPGCPVGSCDVFSGTPLPGCGENWNYPVATISSDENPDAGVTYILDPSHLDMIFQLVPGPKPIIGHSVAPPTSYTGLHIAATNSKVQAQFYTPNAIYSGELPGGSASAPVALDTVFQMTDPIALGFAAHMTTTTYGYGGNPLDGLADTCGPLCPEIPSTMWTADNSMRAFGYGPSVSGYRASGLPGYITTSQGCLASVLFIETNSSDCICPVWKFRENWTPKALVTLESGEAKIVDFPTGLGDNDDNAWRIMPGSPNTLVRTTGALGEPFQFQTFSLDWETGEWTIGESNTVEIGGEAVAPYLNMVFPIGPDYGWVTFWTDSGFNYRMTYFNKDFSEFYTPAGDIAPDLETFLFHFPIYHKDSYWVFQRVNLSMGGDPLLRSHGTKPADLGWYGDSGSCGAEPPVRGRFFFASIIHGADRTNQPRPRGAPFLADASAFFAVLPDGTQLETKR